MPLPPTPRDPLLSALFGSRARGDARDGSDWDLAVVLPDDAPDRLLDPIEARRAVRSLRLPVDVIPVRRADFEEGRHYFGSLAQIIVDEGRLVYGA